MSVFFFGGEVCDNTTKLTAIDSLEDWIRIIQISQMIFALALFLHQPNATALTFPVN